MKLSLILIALFLSIAVLVLNIKNYQLAKDLNESLTGQNKGLKIEHDNLLQAIEDFDTTSYLITDMHITARDPIIQNVVGDAGGIRVDIFLKNTHTCEVIVRNKFFAYTEDGTTMPENFKPGSKIRLSDLM